jgi:hypothetical protein
MTTNTAELKRDLLDDDGENRAVRSFLMLYGGANPKIGQMRDHLAMSGFDGCWPDWVLQAFPSDHLTKGGAQSWIRHLFSLEADSAEQVSEREALAKINEIRNSIIGLQKLNWSEHVYPLVAALDAAGYEGMPYPEARKNFGTLLERAVAAEHKLAALSAPERKVTELPPLPEWCKRDDLGGLVPSEIRTEMREYALAALNQQGEQTAPEWISLKDRPPEIDRDVRFRTHSGNEYSGWLTVDEDWWVPELNTWIGGDGKMVTHWMPIEAAPSTAQKDGGE